MSAEYQSLRTITPPVLRQRDGQWFIVVVAASVEIEAPVGAWFTSEFLSKVVAPAVQPPTESNTDAQTLNRPDPAYLPPYDR